MTTNREMKARILLVMLLFPLTFLLGAAPVATEHDEMRGTFFAAAIPAIIIVFLVPVIIRGSPGQKITALILLFPAAGFGFMGWAGAIGEFIEFCRSGG